MVISITKKLLFVRLMFVFIVSLHTCGSNRVKRGFCSTRNLDIKNGDYRLRSGNSVAEFTCDDGFKLYGVERIVCFTAKWSSDPPICISNTCKKILPTSTMKIEEELDGSVLKFSCTVMHKLDGLRQLICDGTHWNGPSPSCTPWDPPLTCDFESPDLCGWSHHDKADQDWRWNYGKTSTSRTGPSYDHTLGDENGHYMYFETSSPTRPTHNAVLQSPLYPPEFSRQKCFSFWYHIFGEGDISDLEVFIKPESVQDLNKLQQIFHVNENGGDVWYNKSVQIPLQSEPFQVLLVATRATNYRSDIAIDDVAMEECAGILPPVYINTTKITAASTKPITTVQISTRTSPIPTTQTTTTLPKTRHPPTTRSPTTRSPTTTVTTQTIKTTLKTPTPAVTTTSKRTTTVLIQKSSSSSTVTRPTTSQVTNVTHTSPWETTSKQTLKPVVNPNLTQGKKHVPGEASDGPSVIWIVLGVTLVLVIAGAILFGIYMYRRRQNRCRKHDSLSSSNPLYIAVNGDESAVHFACDDTNGLGDF